MQKVRKFTMILFVERIAQQISWRFRAKLFLDILKSTKRVSSLRVHVSNGRPMIVQFFMITSEHKAYATFC
jgi:hypothetical protein